MKFEALAPLFLVASMAGCTSVGTVHEADILYKHTVRMDRDGAPLNVATGDKMSVEQFKELHLKPIMSSIQDHITTTKNRAAKRIATTDPEPNKETIDRTSDDQDTPYIVIYLHGAPLFVDVSVAETRVKFQQLTASNPNWYPIIFNWNGVLWDAYLDHLFRLRQGRRVSTVWGTATAPVYAIADFLKSIVIAPAVWSRLSGHVIETEFPKIEFSDEKPRSMATARQIVALDIKPTSASATDCPTNLQISDTYPADPKLSADTLVKLPVDTAASVPLFALAPFVASYGSSVWTNYNRRAQAAIRQMSEFDIDASKFTTADDAPSGAFAILVREIIEKYGSRKEKKQNAAKPQIAEAAQNARTQPRIILIGHSTGAIMISELIGAINANEDSKNGMTSNEDPESAITAKKDHGNAMIDKIVFLGAAVTIGDVFKTIVPFLAANKDTSFYNISLNAYHEAKSSYKAVVTPSLLEWLDNLIAQPSSHLDRVMGKWENVMLAMHAIPCDIRNRVHLKHLPSGDGYPTTHRDMDEPHREFNPFRESAWKVNKQL